MKIKSAEVYAYSKVCLIKIVSIQKLQITCWVEIGLTQNILDKRWNKMPHRGHTTQKNHVID